MATDLDWPSMLPNMLLDSHALKPMPLVARTDMDQGAARQRRRSTATPTDVTFSLVLDATQMQAFEAWTDYRAGYGAAWFNVPLRMPTGLVSCEARFKGESEYKLLKRDLWRVSGTLEVRDRPMISDAALQSLLDA